ncbi:hypothetical protein COCNU_13G003530 [Cocos nucifera]|uniref:Uncharacterized protein n=1 Tax=Cocos nucifera TaxID=13894 RepID=A0A8K0ITE5_COCNU|nr:hypothetical protein COCNU_13G003530 [Cocos nucifera]
MVEWKVENRIIKIKLETEGRIVDTYQTVVEAFKAAMDFEQEKIQVINHFKASDKFYEAMIAFGQEVFNIGHETRFNDCRRQVAAWLLDVNLSFLDEEEDVESLLVVPTAELLSVILASRPSSVIPMERVWSHIDDLEEKVRELNKKIAVQRKKLSKARKVLDEGSMEVERLRLFIHQCIMEKA